MESHHFAALYLLQQELEEPNLEWLPAARRAWAAGADDAWSDPARLHHPGRRAGQYLDTARASLAALLGVRPAEVYLTSSGPTACAAAKALNAENAWPRCR